MKTLKDKEQSDLTELRWFWTEDVKEAVLEFETVLKKAIEDNCLDIKTEETLDVFKDIIGEFKK